MHWFDRLAGQYSIPDRWVGLDYKELFLDPLMAEVTYAHEVTHAVLAMQSDFGQATNIIFKLESAFTKLPNPIVDEVLESLSNAQIDVQEGFATFMEISNLRRRTSKQYALSWAFQNLPVPYQRWLDPLLFAYNLSTKYREFFTSKVSWLAMETGVRRALVKQDLLSNPKKLRVYLSDADNNPNARLAKLCETLRYKSWLLTKDNKAIADECGVKYHEPATKREVAEFLNYAISFTDQDRTFTANDIGDTPKGSDAFIQASQNMIVANMNLRLADTAKVIFDNSKFLEYTDGMELIFVNIHDKNWKHKDFVRLLTGKDAEIAICGLINDDQKYLTITSKAEAASIINNQLKHTTLLVKWGGYDPLKNRLIWSDTVRQPELVVYNSPNEMKARLSQLLKKKSNVKFRHLHMGASEKHPFQSLLVKINNDLPIHVVNAFGNKGITKILHTIKSRTRVLTNKEVLDNKRHINNLMCFWMGMPWKVDWVETMLNKTEIKYRE